MWRTDRSRAVRGGVLGVAVVLGLSGCGATPDEEQSSSRVQRFIREAPQEILEFSALGRAVAVGELPMEPASWTAGPSGTTHTADEVGILLTREDRSARWIETQPGLVAGDIDAIDVEVEGLRLESSVTISWWSIGPEGQPIHSSIGRRSGRPPSEGSQVFRFDVGQSRGWRGTIERLRVEIGRRPTAEVRIGSIRLLRVDNDPEAVASAVKGGWAVELDGVTRSAMIGLPGARIGREIEVHQDSRLRFFWGAPSFLDTAVDLTVWALPAIDPHLAEKIVLWERSLDPVDPSELGRWHSSELDLGGLAPGRYIIQLETTPRGEIEAFGGLPLWGDPVVRRRSDDPRPNVVVICLDTLRADHLSLYGYHRETSPVIDEWAVRRAVTFETVVAPSPWTLPSHVSLFTGLDAHRHGVNHPVRAPSSLDTLAERLRAAGYSTMAVTGGRYLDASYGLFQGFDAFSSPGDDYRDEIAHEVRQTLDWLASAASSEPFFLFFHTYEVHDPYWPREPAYSTFRNDHPGDPGRSVIARTIASRAEDGFRRRREFLQRGGSIGEAPIAWENTDDVVALYDSGITRADTHVGRLLDAIDELGLTGDTVIVLTSDHGEALGEHRLAGHTSLYDHDLLVPLVMALPDGAMAGRRVSQQVRLLDLTPTLLDLAGVTNAVDMDGVSLLPLLRDGGPGLEAISLASLTNFGLSLRTAGGRKLIVQNTPWPAPTGSIELYDTTSDPMEENDLTTGRARLLESLMSGYGSEATGLFLELTNDQSWPMVVRLDPSPSVSIARNTVKTTDHETRCSVKQKRFLQCELEAGQSTTLLFEELDSTEVAFEIAIGIGVRSENLQLDIDLGDGPGPWRGTSQGQVKGFSIEARWQGPLAITSAAPETADDKLRDQLRALGYIE